MYRYLFGPVPSRRLGMSLGVDLVPHKVCSFNCVYCECGPTTKLTTRREEYVPISAVLAELRDFLEKGSAPDYITFSGAGEPTLNSGIGRVLRFVKERPGAPPAAVLTNGSLFSDPDVRSDLLAADVILPSLDAATERSYRRIDRPFHGISLESYIQGLIDFRNEYAGKIWLEVMILPGYNDNAEDLDALKESFTRIRPDSIQINTLDRPGTEKGLRAADRGELERIVSYWGLDNVEIIAAAPERKRIPSYRSDMEAMLLETLARRPCTVEDLTKLTGSHANEVNKYLGALEGEGRIEAERQARGIFYRLRRP